MTSSDDVLAVLLTAALVSPVAVWSLAGPGWALTEIGVALTVIVTVVLGRRAHHRRLRARFDALTTGRQPATSPTPAPVDTDPPGALPDREPVDLDALLEGRRSA